MKSFDGRINETDKSAQVWFKNRRAKCRQQQKQQTQPVAGGSASSCTSSSATNGPAPEKEKRIRKRVQFTSKSRTSGAVPASAVESGASAQPQTSMSTLDDAHLNLSPAEYRNLALNLSPLPTICASPTLMVPAHPSAGSTAAGSASGALFTCTSPSPYHQVYHYQQSGVHATHFGAQPAAASPAFGANSIVNNNDNGNFFQPYTNHPHR